MNKIDQKYLTIEKMKELRPTGYFYDYWGDNDYKHLVLFKIKTFEGGFRGNEHLDEAYKIYDPYEQNVIDVLSMLSAICKKYDTPY